MIGTEALLTRRRRTANRLGGDDEEFTDPDHALPSPADENERYAAAQPTGTYAVATIADYTDGLLALRLSASVGPVPRL